MAGYTCGMSDEIILNGKTYVSSKKAAEATGYARDYIGQLSRGGQIDAERVGGLWYVSMESLQDYEKNAEIARSFSPVTMVSKEADSMLSFEGKDYISASRASKLTGYNQDYVGQLARGGKIPSRQIGNRWYVDRDALTAHKAEKDALLAAVQAESVGLRLPTTAAVSTPQMHVSRVPVAPNMEYSIESTSLLPNIPSKIVSPPNPVRDFSEIRQRQVRPEVLTLKEEVEETAPEPAKSAARPPIVSLHRAKRRRLPLAAISGGVLTIILVLSVGIIGFKGTDTVAGIFDSKNIQNLGASAANATRGIGDVIEDWVSPELTYTRGQ